MLLDSTESTAARRSADRSARVLAAIALVAAALALVPVASSGKRTDAAVASSPTAILSGTDTTRPKPAERGRAPSYFGYLEFDWDRGVPGFDPWLVDGSRP